MTERCSRPSLFDACQQIRHDFRLCFAPCGPLRRSRTLTTMTSMSRKPVPRIAQSRLPLPFLPRDPRAASGRCVSLASIVEREHPIHRLTGVRRRELAFAGIGKFTDACGLATARVEPPRLHGRAGDLVHADFEFPAHGCIDHRVTAIRIAGANEAITASARDSGGNARDDNHRIIRHTRQEWTRKKKLFGVLHLTRAGLIERLRPRHDRVVYRLSARLPKLPDGVVAISVATSAAEQIPVKRASNIAGDGVTKPLCIKGYRVIF